MENAMTDTVDSTEQKRDGYTAVHVAGHTSNVLWFDPRSTSCGSIHDGVALAHGQNGCWVIAYDDLIRMARDAALSRRQSLDEILGAA
jgi:hypothetical protein